MADIYYLKGDATQPEDTGGMRFILHVCNNVGGWGAGFVLALSKRWKLPEEMYRAWDRAWENTSGFPFQLGMSQFVRVSNDIRVVNMIAQDGYRSNINKRPLSYNALSICLKSVFEFAWKTRATLHMPRIGCGLAGGSWCVIEDMLFTLQKEYPVDIYVYDLK